MFTHLTTFLRGLFSKKPAPIPTEVTNPVVGSVRGKIDPGIIQYGKNRGTKYIDADEAWLLWATHQKRNSMTGDLSPDIHAAKELVRRGKLFASQQAASSKRKRSNYPRTRHDVYGTPSRILHVGKLIHTLRAQNKRFQDVAAEINQISQQDSSYRSRKGLWSTSGVRKLHQKYLLQVKITKASAAQVKPRADAEPLVRGRPLLQKIRPTVLATFRKKQGYREAAKALNTLGIRTGEGNEWSYYALYQFVKREDFALHLNRNNLPKTEAYRPAPLTQATKNAMAVYGD